jgi:hypothetical protein
MAALKPFNHNEHQPSKPYEPVPNGEYRAAIVESDNKQTNDKKGTYLALTFEILEQGPQKGRRLFVNLNLENANAKAVEIAHQDLCAICLAVGIKKTLEDSQELHNIPLRIVVKVKPKKPRPGEQSTGELENKIVEYKRADGSKVTSPPGTQPNQPASAPAGAAPWKR